MEEKQESEKQYSSSSRKSSTKIFTIILAAILIMSTLVSSAILGYQKIYEGKIYHGTKISDIDMGGLTTVEALKLLEKTTTQMYEDGIQYQIQDTTANIPSTVTFAEGGETAYDIFSYDLNNTIEKAYQSGRDKSLFQNIEKQILSILGENNIPVEVYYNDKLIEAELKKTFQNFEEPATNAELHVDENNDFYITEEIIGSLPDYSKALNDTKKHIQTFSSNIITISLIQDYPEITKENIENAKNKAYKLIEKAPLYIKYENKSFEISKNELASWIGFKKNENIDTEPTITLKAKIVSEYLASISDSINVDTRNGKFERHEDGTFTILEEPETGKGVNVTESIKYLEEQILEEEKQELTIAVEVTEPEVTIDNIMSMNIVEKIGEGTSSFAGSSWSRIHNITTGMNKLNGLLITPDEEFSLVSVLSPITKEAGYKDELVIKGDETKPEVGGGLCQIGTTTFRGAINTGLPITSRRNHSYVVSYYYPIGTDATIYDPAPDFKFINDTGNYILLQTKMEGSSLRFEFWGKNDERKVEVGDPITYNWVDPPPKKLIETEDLAPGEEKCTEKAHKGVEASFDYKVTYADGEIMEETFHSKYKPWQEVCLVGKQPEEEPKKEITEKSNEAGLAKTTTE